MTRAQELLLVDLCTAHRAVCPYELGTLVSVFRNLGKAGLAECLGGSGQHSKWTATEKGRKVFASRAALEGE